MGAFFERDKLRETSHVLKCLPAQRESAQEHCTKTNSSAELRCQDVLIRTCFAQEIALQYRSPKGWKFVWIIDNKQSGKQAIGNQQLAKPNCLNPRVHLNKPG
jgi:hypothetical protein